MLKATGTCVQIDLWPCLLPRFKATLAQALGPFRRQQDTCLPWGSVLLISGSHRSKFVLYHSLAMQVWASNLNFLNPFEKVFVLFVCLGLKFQSQAQGFSKQQLQKLILVLLFSEYRLGTMGSSSWGDRCPRGLEKAWHLQDQRPLS